MGVPKKLTEMQMKFAHEIVTNEGRKNATECATDAGYTKDTAVVKASQLQNPKLRFLETFSLLPRVQFSQFFLQMSTNTL